MIKISPKETHFLIKVLEITALALIMFVSIAGAAPYAYIPDNENNVSVIDIATDKVTATVDVGSSTHSIAVNSAGTKAYIVGDHDSVYVIDTATNKVTDTVKVGDYSLGLAVNPVGSKVYVTDNYEEGTVYVIDTVSNKVTATIPVGYYPKGIAVSPDGANVYVTNHQDSVSVINTSTNTVTVSVSVGNSPYGIVVNPSGTKVYVANSDSNTVSVIDTATNIVTATVNVGICPYEVAVNPDGTKVYVTNMGKYGASDNTVSVIDTQTNTVTDTVKVGWYPKGVAVSPDGKKVYVVNSQDYNVSVIDTTTNKVIDTVKVGIFPDAFGQFIAPPISNIASTVPKEETTPLAAISSQEGNDQIVYRFDPDNGKNGNSPWGIPLSSLPSYGTYHLPATEGYIAIESQYNFIDNSISPNNNDPTDGNGYYFNTLSPDNMQWKWDGHNLLLGASELIPGSQDHVSNKNGIHWPSGKGAKVRIYSPYTGKTVIAVVGENGPAPWTGRQFGASNKVFRDLGLLSPHNRFSKENPNPGHGSKNSDPAKYPVIKYADNPYWVEVSWADQSLPAGPLTLETPVETPVETTVETPVNAPVETPISKTTPSESAVYWIEDQRVGVFLIFSGSS